MVYRDISAAFLVPCLLACGGETTPAATGSGAADAGSAADGSSDVEWDGAIPQNFATGSVDGVPVTAMSASQVLYEDDLGGPDVLISSLPDICGSYGIQAGETWLFILLGPASFANPRLLVQELPLTLPVYASAADVAPIEGVRKGERHRLSRSGHALQGLLEKRWRATLAEGFFALRGRFS